MKKLIATLLSAAVTLLTVSVFSACGEDAQIVKEPEKVSGTEGIEYTLSDDGEHYICTGIGTAEGTQISIASWYNEKWVTEIGEGAFYQKVTLESVTIPDSVTSIGAYAFWGCIGLESLTIPDSVETIGDSAFKYCMKLKSLTIPGNGSTVIADYAFEWCESLESLVIGDGVRTIGDSFYVCSSLADITISDKVTSIGGSAFYNTAYYDDTANWTDGVLYIGNHLIKADYQTFNKSSYTVKDGTVTLANEAFDGCSNLASITLPDSLTSIGNSAFGGCYLLSRITIPANVSLIGNYAFSSCRLINATFENPRGWSCTPFDFGAKAVAVDETILADASKAAQLLISDYQTYSWKRG